jgi:hypothetical protein
MDKNKDRHLELTSKLIEMGSALMVEGEQNKDYIITQTGTFMILLGGLMFNEEDVEQFGLLCSMFSAKKLLDNIDIEENSMSSQLNEMGGGESYEEFVKRINKLRGNTDGDA